VVDETISIKPGLGESKAGKSEISRFIYVSDMHEMGILLHPHLSSLTERHRIKLERPPLRQGSEIIKESLRNKASGIIVEMQRGWPNRRDLMLSRKVLKAGFSLFYYWPREEAVEIINGHRLSSMASLFLYVSAFRVLFFFSKFSPLDDADLETRHQNRLQAIQDNIHPLPMRNIKFSGGHPKIDGKGIYLRADYWADMRSGGSYGHTCYVAKELAKATGNFTCLMGSRFELLDTLGLNQVVMSPPSVFAHETDMLDANLSYHDSLRVFFEIYQPDYIYERLVPGNYEGARLCQELKIPYLVEYNGSEIVMRRSFGDGKGFRFEHLFLEAEKLAFEQATAINVVSDVVKDSLVEIGIDPQKILVNPNCADPEAYAPGTDEEVIGLRGDVGWNGSNIVIGFVGTFGGWHGIEVLAKALPRIAEEVPNARFLLIGKGNLQNLIIDSIDRNDLHDKVHMPGMLPQQETAHLMKMCDIFVSPHHRDMGTMKFFGSPTKVFEYMSLGAGIVASDLEQIGEVLSPSLQASDLEKIDLEITDQRSVLCQPGSVDDFVSAVVGLAKRPEVIKAIGANARQAILEKYSWSKHVERFLDFTQGLENSLYREAQNVPEIVEPGEDQDIDPFKKEIIDQWDNDPCGSHYAALEGKTRFEWFKEVEQFRHEEFGPWMCETMEFSDHAGESVLEIGGGMGTDLVQFATAGAIVTDLDMSTEHLNLARENFELRNLEGTFIHGDAEDMPFDDNSFDLVYTNGVIHHTPNTKKVIDEIYRVLKPGGEVICMVYAESSIQYWRDLVLWRGLRQGQLQYWSMGEIMSRSVEISETGARPLVKVYRPKQLKEMFGDFTGARVFHRQLMPHEPPKLLRWLPVSFLQKIMGWNLVIKARKPQQ